jgi:ketosteroid isomerase-like protein
MSQMNEPTAIVRKAYDCFAKHDINGIVQLVANECDWQAPGPAGEMAWAGSFSGPDGVRKFFDKLDENVEFLDFSPSQFLSDGATVVVMGRERDRVKATGKIFEVAWAHCFEIKDGKIIRFRDYQDTAAIQAAMH